ncbi:MAG: hypothetical protein PHE70_02460 [Tepidanaerobacteraceae bacterium]|nr:hypothetical protein [Tepidanaerobacteraceae bacterium]
MLTEKNISIYHISYTEPPKITSNYNIARVVRINSDEEIGVTLVAALFPEIKREL